MDNSERVEVWTIVLVYYYCVKDRTNLQTVDGSVSLSVNYLGLMSMWISGEHSIDGSING